MLLVGVNQLLLVGVNTDQKQGPSTSKYEEIPFCDIFLQDLTG